MISEAINHGFQKHVTSNFEITSFHNTASRIHASLGIGMFSGEGNVTERNNSNEKTRPKKCERIAFADA